MCDAPNIARLIGVGSISALRRSGIAPRLEPILKARINVAIVWRFIPRHVTASCVWIALVLRLAGVRDGGECASPVVENVRALRHRCRCDARAEHLVASPISSWFVCCWRAAFYTTRVWASTSGGASSSAEAPGANPGATSSPSATLSRTNALSASSHFEAMGSACHWSPRLAAAFATTATTTALAHLVLVHFALSSCEWVYGLKRQTAYVPRR